MDLKEQARQLTDELLRAQKAYYVDGRSIISDLEYDRLFDELVRIESEHPELKDENSPTSRVGSDLTSDFPEVSHTIPVLSLDKAYSSQEVVAWMEKTARSAGRDLSFVEEEKIDGISIVLYYENGIFVRALTRGNGYVGNDVSSNVKTVKTVPLVLTEPVTIAVRGEIYLAKKDFEALRESSPEVANPRNMAAGTVRRQKSSEAAAVPLTIFVYEGFWADESKRPDNHLAILASLKRLGFRINPHLAVFSSSKEQSEKLLEKAGLEAEPLAFGDLAAYLERVTERRASLEYEIDGMVTKVNELDVREALGYTEHHPRWAIAYKFESPQAVTKVKAVTVQVGRTGRITPVAELEPVQLGGSVVRRATLHNQEYIDSLELALGDTVSVVKRGDVIPAVENVIEKNNEGNTTYHLPPDCPCCHTPIVQIGGLQYCPNYDCPDQVKGRIAYFASTDQMDIETLGPKTVELLYNAGILRSIEDIYNADYTRASDLPGIGEKSIKLLLKGIKESLERPFVTVLSSLGVADIGKKSAEILVKNGFDSMAKILNAVDRNDKEAFASIPGFGELTAERIISSFSSQSLRKTIEELEKVGIHMDVAKDAKEESKEQIFSGEVWCITGSFKNFNPRTKALKEIEKRGGRTVSSVTSKTTHLLAGEGGGSKRAEAERLGVKIVTEDEFMKAIGTEEAKEEGEDGQLFLF